ncbi:RNA polymerase sigma factor [Candidatus Palauibacter sp.]|uniref:RNA polymerase sigma factor n=1 Tax=Candidatus Palauibacter sp. TaxID=3101350 RepID=UPI003B0292BD
MIEATREELLAQRVVAGNREALEDLYEDYSEQLFAVAYRLTNSSADALDILHDVFFRLPEALKTYDQRGSLATWLRAVTRRHALMHLRARKRRREVPLFAGDVPKRPPQVIELVALERALAKLPEKLRIVIILKEIEGYSHKEIAALLDVSYSASAVRLHRARAALRTALGEK